MSSAPGSSPPRICCLDLDTFFVSVERVLDPTLEGQPVVVGGRPGQRGVVTACSYEVRRHGVRSGMSLVEATRLAPHAVFLPTRHSVYEPYAQEVRAIARRYCPEVQVASIDEMYMDFSGCERLYCLDDEEPDTTITRVVGTITGDIRRELGLPASAGIASSKSTAKIACGLAKPAGVVLVPAGREAEVLAPLPVRKLPGIGPVAERRLAEIGVTTLGVLGRTPAESLRTVFGNGAASMARRARGEARERLGRERPAFWEHDPSGDTVGSISNERTFSYDIGSTDVIQSMLCALAERVCWRARKRGVKARTVTLKLRYRDFETLNRSRTIPATDADRDVIAVVQMLFRRARQRSTKVRLLGVALSNLAIEPQLEMLPGPAVEGVVDQIRDKYGFDSVRRALGRGRR